MAFHHGSESKFSVDDSGGTLRDLSAFIDTVDAPLLERDLHDTTTIGNASGAHTFSPGLKNGSITISGHWDPTVTTGPDPVLAGLLNVAIGTTTSIEWGPEGGTTGDIKYTAESLCKSYKVNASSTDITKFSAEFQITGAVTRGTFA